MTRRAAAESLPLPFPSAPTPPASGPRAKARLRCPGLLPDDSDRAELRERRRADCAHLIDAENEWIEGFGAAQAKCPAVCLSFIRRAEGSLVVLRRGASGVAAGAADGERRAPKVNKVLGQGPERRCSRCRKNLARPPLEKRWGKTPRYRWCAPCAEEHAAAKVMV